MDPGKLEAVQHMTLPKSKKMAMSLIGTFNWLRNLIDHFAYIIKPIVDTLKRPKFVLTEQVIASINQLKQELLKAPVLINPIPEETIHVVTDSSAYCMGGSLGHVHDDQFHPITYSSKILTSAERDFPTFKRELLAIWTFVAQ